MTHNDIAEFLKQWHGRHFDISRKEFHRLADGVSNTMLVEDSVRSVRAYYLDDGSTIFSVLTIKPNLTTFHIVKAQYRWHGGMM